jgi:GNAT superfamily N-acetyltransferase
MNQLPIKIRDTRDIPREAVLDLYQANNWSSANKPDELHQALLNSHSLVTAWDGDRLVGLANAISDGFLVVYYPHVVVHPDFQRKGIGRELMARLMNRYEGFHQHCVLADKNAVAFYESCGFERSICPAMWIYDGDDH